MTVTISALEASGVWFQDPTGLNNEGVAVGAGDAVGAGLAERYFGAIWQNGTVVSLSGLNGPWAINDSGQIVGGNYTSNTSSAVLWQNGAVQSLSSLGGTVTAYSESAYGLNNAGVIVGQSAAPGGLVEACMWVNGVATNLGTLAGGNTPVSLGGQNSFEPDRNSYAADINASGQIVGASLTTGDLYHAVLWQSGKINDLGVFAPGDQSFANAINASGEVVGYDLLASGGSQAVLWQNGKMTDLGTLPGDNFSKANGINASGIIVGNAGIYNNPAGAHAVMWQNGQIYDLNNLISPTSGWFLQTADAINDNGEIIGQGTLPNGRVGGTYELSLTGNVAVIGATVQTALQPTVTASVAVVDSGANVLSSLDALEALWQKGLLTSITLSDQTAPAWTLTVAQLDSDADALAVLESPVSLTVSGTAADISAALDGLSVGVAAGKIGSITISAGSVIGLTSDQLASDQAALKAITSENFSLTVTPSSASASIDGTGYGTTVILWGAAALYTLTSLGDGTGFTLSGNYVNDTINNVTALQFADKTVTVAADNSFDEYTALLYQGALGRTPDPAGLQHWEALANALPASERADGIYALSNYSGNYNGTLSIAAGFTNSAEFVSKYGSLTNAQFVTKLYSNILDRAPDSGGYASWVNDLTPVSQGGLGESREYVLVGFAESAEAVSNATQGFTGQSGAHAAWLMLF